MNHLITENQMETLKSKFRELQGDVEEVGDGSNNFSNLLEVQASMEFLLEDIAEILFQIEAFQEMKVDKIKI